MAESKHQQRIQSKTTLVKALELIASDKVKDTSKKNPRWILRIDPEAVKILTRIIGPDANLGWRLLRGCDSLSLYGSQIPLAFNSYCAGEPELFIYYIQTQKSEMMQWIDRQYHA